MMLWPFLCGVLFGAPTYNVLRLVIRFQSILSLNTPIPLRTCKKNPDGTFVSLNGLGIQIDL
ncbi:hypothetical protein [Acinetobacter sp. 1592897]|uniref:hypothetical protein n=1 Tax=Acinetobacter sp. 1592897 TaxID=1310696 RepID=UPI0012DB2480|nr:hypothetical protein [Acinetobacter sp. 1592897]